MSVTFEQLCGAAEVQCIDAMREAQCLAEQVLEHLLRVNQTAAQLNDVSGTIRATMEQSIINNAVMLSNHSSAMVSANARIAILETRLGTAMTEVRKQTTAYNHANSQAAVLGGQLATALYNISRIEEEKCTSLEIIYLLNSENETARDRIKHLVDEADTARKRIEELENSARSVDELNTDLETTINFESGKRVRKRCGIDPSEEEPAANRARVDVPISSRTRS
jgi:chromosome segregation ATPase